MNIATSSTKTIDFIMLDLGNHISDSNVHLKVAAKQTNHRLLFVIICPENDFLFRIKLEQFCDQRRYKYAGWQQLRK